MRNKLITIAALFAVMVAMTGIAAALPYDAALLLADGVTAAPVPLDIKVGDSMTLSYKAYNIDPLALAANAGAGEIIPYFTSVTVLSGVGALSTDVTVATPLNLQLSSDPKIDVAAITVSVSSSAPVGARYRVEIGAGSGTTIEIGSASRNVNAIPEFPTVALPIAAVIGLVFFFQNKKRKEE